MQNRTLKSDMQMNPYVQVDQTRIAVDFGEFRPTSFYTHE